jgi:hypothetical protein
MYLRGPSKEKHHDIVDYVNLTAPYYENPSKDSSTSEIIEQIVKTKTGPVRPKLEDVSVAQWNLANVRIMDVLFESPTIHSVRNYMAYTARVNSYFSKFDRVKVLLYDRAYRVKQAEFQCPWGIDMGFLKDEYLADADSGFEQGKRFAKTPATDRAPFHKSYDRTQNAVLLAAVGRSVKCTIAILGADLDGDVCINTFAGSVVESTQNMPTASQCLAPWIRAPLQSQGLALEVVNTESLPSHRH